jgi:hypothetical protein
MSDDFEDVTLGCKDCGTTFVWTAGEQQYYTEHAFSRPRRCKPCRLVKRQRQEETAAQRFGWR